MSSCELEEDGCLAIRIGVCVVSSAALSGLESILAWSVELSLIVSVLWERRAGSRCEVAVLDICPRVPVH